jgi:hypothetical protein
MSRRCTTAATVLARSISVRSSVFEAKQHGGDVGGQRRASSSRRK